MQGDAVMKLSGALGHVDRWTLTRLSMMVQKSQEQGALRH
jgi:hypothetical protein